MIKDKTILVCGIGEQASATARRLFGEGYAVVLCHARAPQVLRRKMCFADAWHDGSAHLDGIEARRADVGAELVLGLRTREFIPLLRGSLFDIVERWPWDVIVATREESEPAAPPLLHLAELTIGLGSRFRAGADCDLVVETEGLDPGAILRQGDTPWRGRAPSARQGKELVVRAPAAGQFRSRLTIAGFVDRGELLGVIDGVEIRAPCAGRIRGVARQKRAVVVGAPLVEIALSPTARCVGVSDRSQLISRGVSFAVEMECEGLKLLPTAHWWSN